MNRHLLVLFSLFLTVISDQTFAGRWYLTSDEARGACNAAFGANCGYTWYFDTTRCVGNGKYLDFYYYHPWPLMDEYYVCASGYVSCPNSGAIRDINGNCICPPGQAAVNGACTLTNEAIPRVKNNGRPSCALSAGNPINTGTGNKFQREIDFQGAGDFPLMFERIYNSDPMTVSVAFSPSSGWRHTFERSIAAGSDANTKVAFRSDGQALIFTLVGTIWQAPADTNLQLAWDSTSGWWLTDEDGTIERYDAAGKLQSLTNRSGISQTLLYDSTTGLLKTVTHSSGRTLQFGYDGVKRLASMTNSANRTYLYQYDYKGNLATVVYPDTTKTNYLYGELANTANVSQPHALTGIVDENSNRFATWTYDSQGRATSSQHAGGAEYVGVNYGTNSSTITDALGTQRTTSLQTILGVVKSAGSSQPSGAGCPASASNITYDVNGNVASRVDFNGHVSCYAYDLSRNLETARLEGMAPGSSCPADLSTYTPAAGTAERVILTQWHPTFRLPAQINETGRQTVFNYTPSGNLLSKTVTDTATQQSRTWTYTYNNLGQVLTEDGPRTDVNDVTTYTYYSDSTSSHKPGDLKSKTNALGHITQYTAYDYNGRLLSMTDPNGLVVSLAYDLRGRLTSNTVGSEVTTYGYYPTGLLKRVTWPGGAYLDYRYDDAHRLVEIEDQAGNTVTYTLDPMGNRTQEAIRDPGGQLARRQTRVYDALSRLQNLIQTP